MSHSVARGALVSGQRGRAMPAPAKVLKAIAFVWHLLGKDEVSEEEVLYGGGTWAFFLQFRRPAFVALQDLWTSLDSQFDGLARWRVAAEEFLLCVLMLPLLHIDFRLVSSGIVLCSDASERGGGVVISRQLSRSGEESLLSRLATLPDLLRGSIGLVESCAGIGGARRAFDLLGLT